MAYHSRVVFDRPEVRLVSTTTLCHGLVLTSVRPDWLDGLESAFNDAAAERGGPAPWLMVLRIDPRFPLRPGYDGLLREHRESAMRLHRKISAMAVVVQIDGIVRAAIHAMLATIRMAVRAFPITTHNRVIDALLALEPHREPTAERSARWREDLSALEASARALGTDLQG